MPDYSPRNERIAEHGEWGTVEYAIRQNGEMEAKVWLEAQSGTVRASFAHLFRVIANGLTIRNKTQFRHLRGEIWEFKRGGNRLFTFRDENAWFLTHHLKKGGASKCPRKDIDRADNIRVECLNILDREG